MEQTKTMTNPLGTERIGKLMVRFAVPSIIALVINSLYNIDNRELFETGKKIEQERICDFQMELSKIEYTLQYLNNNQQYSQEKGFYERNIPKRTIIDWDYTGNLSDIRKIEIESGKLYTYAQSKKFSTVFPAGLLISQNGEQLKTKIFLFFCHIISICQYSFHQIVIISNRLYQFK